MFVDDPFLDSVLSGMLLSVMAVIWVVFVVRLVGLRAFSKMTAFDFVVTVAIGSLLAGASQSTDWPGVVQSAVAMASLLGAQYAVARMRRASPRLDAVLQNTPVLLMRDGVMLHDALAATRVTEDDLTAKLREANVLDLSQVRAVVLETTGDISVLQGDHLHVRVLQNVRRVPPA